jgi:hypothetical protein
MKIIYFYKLTDAKGNVQITAVDQTYTECFIGGIAADGLYYWYEHEDWGDVPEWVHRHGMKLVFCKTEIDIESLN